MNSQMDTVFQKSRPERSRYFKVGDRVIARDYKGKDHKWIGGQIESSDEPLTLSHLYKLLNLCSFPLTVTSRNPRFPAVI